MNSNTSKRLDRKIPAARVPGSPVYFSLQVTGARRFYLNLNPRSRTRLTVVSGGVEECAPDYVIRRREFPFFGVEFVARGRGRLKFGLLEHALSPGSVFCYGPGTPHEILTDPRQTLAKYFVDFAGARASRLLGASQLRPGSFSQIFPPLEVQPLFDELIRCGLRGTPQAPQICARLLEALLLKVAESRGPLPGHQALAFTTYTRCRDHLSRHFLRLRSLKQLATECHLDAAYLCRLFKRYDHQTPSHELRRLKMTFAAGRLQSPGALAKQVAEETGFANPFHFSRAFKSVFGVSPKTLTRMR